MWCRTSWLSKHTPSPYIVMKHFLMPYVGNKGPVTVLKKQGAKEAILGFGTGEVGFKKKSYKNNVSSIK